MTAPLRLADFDYALPPERIAQRPLAERDGARMLVLDRAGATRRHSHVRELPHWLCRGDLLVVNVTRVQPARLRGHKESGGAAEALLVGPGSGTGRFRALLRCRGRLRPGLKLCFERDGRTRDAEVVTVDPDGSVELAFGPGRSPYVLGETPLPPYIRRAVPEAIDEERYQTVFAREPGSVAAPTAGLHLSEPLLERIRAAGIDLAEVVLHVGPGTFRPLGPAELAAGCLHAEPYVLPLETADAIRAARGRGGRVVAVGTTTTRVLESCADGRGGVAPGVGETRLFLKPGDPFRVVDALLTNFHLPRSSLLLLVAAFAGRGRILASYREAVDAGYRFYSYGDAMLIV